MSLEDSQLDEQAFVALLGKLIGEARHLQNNPPVCVPVEDRGLAEQHDVHACAAYGA